MSIKNNKINFHIILLKALLKENIINNHEFKKAFILIQKKYSHIQ